MEIISWLHTNSGAIAGIAAIIIAGATVMLAIITRRYARTTKEHLRLTNNILDENRQMHIDAQKPDIAIRLFTVIGQTGSITVVNRRWHSL